MLFVRCTEGISHSPAEEATQPDVAAAATALYMFLREKVALEAQGEELYYHDEL